MNTAYFPKKVTLLFLGVGVLLAAPPLYEVFHLFQKLNLSNLYDVFAQSKEVRQHLKSLITYGMLLFLCFFTLLYTYLSYGAEPRLKKACLVVLGFLCLGGLGFIFQPNHHVSYRLVNHPLEGIVLTNAQMSIKFRIIPNDLANDLQSALSNEVDIFLSPKFVYTPVYQDVSISFNNQSIGSNEDHKLSKADINTFINGKELIFKVDNPNAILMVRDLKGSPLQEREDTCQINGKVINIPFDQALWFYLKVQHKNGTPIRVYY